VAAEKKREKTRKTEGQSRKRQSVIASLLGGIVLFVAGIEELGN
jgi:hypothetical protein